MIHLYTEIRNHRLGAFVYGFMSGLGLIMIMWGLASVITLPTRSSNIYVGLILFGALLFAGGSCREAFLQGGLSVQPSIREKTPAPRVKPATSLKPAGRSQTGTTAQSVHQEATDLNSLTTEQIRECPVGMQTHESIVYDKEQ